MNIQPDSRTRLLDAALSVFRAKGYNAARVEDICAAAGLTKGGFFHHFRSKEDLALKAAEHWTSMTGRLFEAAPYHDLEDPADRVLAYIDFRKSLLRGTLAEYTCFVGTMVQEVYDSSPEIRVACEQSIAAHVATLLHDLEAAKQLHAANADWSAEGLALHMQSVIQGAFILAKARNDSAVAAESLDHLKRYVGLLLGRHL
ncbi:TetR/AcrR family transcriptional regulator [Rhizobium sp. KVB221]|uniref:TetR/AcrR family transcriptional regulator n=1 Tax=Rhizobium setariae TaxID=2801340 RepID=A0A936YQG5_9HYPH|nr:TetR/AcrR family transcriptional regulator [Rhizobium setariae]MBL0370936.1 TetR/AcrR family transcriptional regulator [Rhizobium setariae]